MENINPELRKSLERLARYKTFRCECEATITAFNLGAISREEMLKRFAFSDNRLKSNERLKINRLDNKSLKP